MHPNVDVIMAAYGQSLMTIRAIDALRSQSRIGSIVLMDDGSPKEESEVLKDIQGVRYFKNQGNEGWIRSINRGVKKTDSQYIIIMNNDVELLPRALEFMANNLDDGAAICGCLLLYPLNYPHPQLRGRVQHAGIAFEADGYPYHPFAHRHPEAPAVRKWRSVNAVTGAALMTKREVWDKIGGFDTKLGMGVFDDADYGLCVKKLRQEVVYEPRAVGYHFEHMSQTQSNNWFSPQNLQTNLAYLFMKHGKPVADDEIYYKVR